MVSAQFFQKKTRKKFTVIRDKFWPQFAQILTWFSINFNWQDFFI
jgi:hypothetical protein